MEALRTLFPSQLQFFMWKTATNEALTVESMNVEDMEIAIANKAATKSTNLLGDSQKEYSILKAQYSSAIKDSERMGVLQQMKIFLFDSVLQNLASNSL